MYVSWRKAALISQWLLLLYFQICIWLPSGAWNNQRSFPVHSLRSAPGPLAIGIGTALLITATSLRIKWLMWIGVVGHAAWFAAQALTLWPPYVIGASPQYAAMYNRAWGQTTKLLPSWRNHLAPDAMHFFIQVLLAAVLITTLVVLLGTYTSSNRSGKNTPSLVPST